MNLNIVAVIGKSVTYLASARLIIIWKFDFLPKRRHYNARRTKCLYTRKRFSSTDDFSVKSHSDVSDDVCCSSRQQGSDKRETAAIGSLWDDSDGEHPHNTSYRVYCYCCNKTVVLTPRLNDLKQRVRQRARGVINQLGPRRMASLPILLRFSVGADEMFSL